MTRLDKIAESLLQPINPTIIIVLGFYTIVWGLWLVVPMWSTFGSSPVYLVMAKFAPEFLWGLLAIIAGMFITRGAIKPSYENLQLGSFIGFFHWLIIGIFYLFGQWQSTAWITAFAFAIYSAIIWVNVKTNRRHFKKGD